MKKNIGFVLLLLMVLNVKVYGQCVYPAVNTYKRCDLKPFSLSLTGINQTTPYYYYWTSSSDGTFSDNSIMYPDYIPSKQDSINGGVQLTLDAGCASLIVNVTFTLFEVKMPTTFDVCATTTKVNLPVVLKGNVTPIFSWFRTSGAATNLGTFDNNYAQNPNYTPQPEEITNGYTTFNAIVSANGCTLTTASTTMQVLYKTQVTYPSITINTPKVDVCDNDYVNITAKLGNIVNNAKIVWTDNGNVLQSSASTNFMLSYPSLGAHSVKAMLLSNDNCYIPAAGVMSNALTINSTKFTTPTVSLNIANQSICKGTTEVATAKAASAGTNSLFKWYVNNVEQMKITGNTFPLSNLNDNDGLSLKAVSDQCLIKYESAETPSYIFTVTPVVSASINIYANKTPFCSGEIPSLYANTNNQGSNPVFQWRVNGVNVVNPDGNANSLSLNSLRNGDKVDVLMTSDQACLVSKTVYSNFVNIKIYDAALVPSVQLFANNNLCPNNSASFTATTNNVGIDEMTSYKWMVNGVLNTNSSYNSNVQLSDLKNGDVITCQVEGAYNLCNTATNPTTLTLQSNSIKMNVSPIICNGFLIKPQLQVLGAKNVNVGESQNFYAGQVPGDTVKLAGVPIKFNWYYKLIDPTGQVSFQRAYILDNNPSAQTVIQNNVSVTFPNNVQKLYAIASYYSSVENDYVAFDTLSHDIVLNNIKSTTKPSCSDTLGCSDYIITSVKIATVENDQLANNTECPYSSHGYSDFSTAEFVYYEIDSVIKTQVNQFASVYSTSSFALQIKGLNQAQYYGVWVDINQDGDFEDAKEFLIASTEPAVVYNTSVVIPSIEGSEGERRLRIRASNNPLSAKDYCGFSNVSKGETEDYLIIIQAYPELKAPQVFTPGVDGYNDYFVVLGMDETAGNTELQVFDKLGNVVYSNTEYDNKWGGLNNAGSKLLNGTYYYRVKNGTREIKGFVELVNEVASAE